MREKLESPGAVGAAANRDGSRSGERGFSAHGTGRAVSQRWYPFNLVQCGMFTAYASP